MTRLPEPNQYAGCYELHVYCDQQECTRWGLGQFQGDTAGEACKVARKRGWRIHSDRTATCPVCMGVSK